MTEFSFDGVSGMAMGLRTERIQSVPVPRATGREVYIPGRPGMFFMPEDGHEQVTVRIVCALMPFFDFSGGADGMLRGREGMLVMSTEPGRMYRARLTDSERSGGRLEMEFTLRPHPYRWPELPDTVLTEPGSVINTGNIESAPRITVEAEGDWSISVGEWTAEVTGGGVIIDSETMECLSADSTEPAYSRVTMEELPVLAPGANAVTWTGSVTRVTVKPRAALFM